MGTESSPPTTGRVRCFGPVNPMSKSGERYKTKAQMMRHEKSESKKDRMMEYGSMKMKNHGTSRKKCS